MRDLKSIAGQDEPSGELRLGAAGSSTCGLMPGILPLMAARFPQIEIYMLSGNGRDLYQKVLDRDVIADVIFRRRLTPEQSSIWVRDCKRKNYNSFCPSMTVRVHSALIPNSLMSGHHFSASALTMAPSVSGVCCARGKVSSPRSRNRDRTAGSPDAF